MARWKLNTPHYLNVEGTEWEQTETPLHGGKQMRKRYTVPRLLDPKDPDCQNRDGEVVVCFVGQGQRTDIEFQGPPTPDMEPLDDEARLISEEMQSQWVHPIESLEGNGYGGALIASFEAQIDALLKKKAAEPVSVSAGQVDPDDFAKLQEQVAALMARNAELEDAKGRRA